MLLSHSLCSENLKLTAEPSAFFFLLKRICPRLSKDRFFAIILSLAENYSPGLAFYIRYFQLLEPVAARRIWIYYWI